MKNSSADNGRSSTPRNLSELERRTDLKHIINAGWTRGAKIPRQVSIGGALQTVYFDPFTPKAIALLGRNLPQATRTRCIELRMLPKRPGERIEAFGQLDDPEFAQLVIKGPWTSGLKSQGWLDERPEFTDRKVVS